jgi:amidase
VCVERWGDATVDPEIAAAVLRAARACEQAGHIVEIASPRFDFEAMLRVLTDCFAFGLAGLRTAGEALGRSPDPEFLEPITYANWLRAERMTARDVDATLAAANGLRRDVGPFFDRYDVLMTPTLANLPPGHGRYSQSRCDVDSLGFMRELQYTDQFLPIFNVTGQPALSIPYARSASGLPIGVQLVGRAARENVILALGQQILETAPAAGPPAVWAGKV